MLEHHQWTLVRGEANKTTGSISHRILFQLSSHSIDLCRRSHVVSFPQLSINMEKFPWTVHWIFKHVFVTLRELLNIKNASSNSISWENSCNLYSMCSFIEFGLENAENNFQTFRQRASRLWFILESCFAISINCILILWICYVDCFIAYAEWWEEGI